MFPAAFLARVEELVGKRIVEHFDLIAGTSTGGIIAIALGLGIPAAQVVHLYQERADAIFPGHGGWRWLRPIKHWWRTAYSPKPLERALREILGDRLLGESLCRLVVPAFDATQGDVRIYKTAHHPTLRADHREPAWCVARATSAAPTYFPSFTTAWGAALVDGGIWANNPAMVALTEALGLLEFPQDQVTMLSLGTTETPISVSRATRDRGGKLQWLNSTIELLMYGQSLAATNEAGHILGKDRFLRVSPIVGSGRFALDRARIVDELMGLGAHTALHELDKIDRRFLQTKVAPFIPHYGPRAAAAD